MYFLLLVEHCFHEIIYIFYQKSRRVFVPTLEKEEEEEEEEEEKEEEEEEDKEEEE